LHLAAQMDNRGRLACVEAIKPRFFRLKANLERGGVTCARLYLKDGRRVGGAVPARFDRVLLDAPCSSEAQFRAESPETWAHWSPRKIKEQARKQRGLLLSAWQALKPGGRLVYATCSLAPEEDEVVLSHLLQRADDVRVIPPDLADNVPAHPGLTEWAGKALDPRLVGARRIRPTAEFDAFFFAVLHKAG
ncbi:MAG: RsmB/NOP family class I SAM-dependent RNA methyltransferase, partial [Myxococcota bacterium]